MFKKIFKKLPVLLLCWALLVAVVPTSTFAEERLLSVDGSIPTSNTQNAFFSANGGGYDGIRLYGDYGSETLSAVLISRERERFIIDLNGHTLTLGYMALNTSVEVRGAGTLKVVGGTVIYDGELYLGDMVRVVSDAQLPVIAHGSAAHIRIGEGVTVLGANAVAEFGVRYEYKENPIFFEKLPEEADGIYGIDRFRVLYENCFGAFPSVSTARVVEFSTESEALEALAREFVTVINPLDGYGTPSTDDDSYLKVEGNSVTVGKNGALLSHANLSLDGALGVNFYFEFSGLEDTVESLGVLVYSGVGEGGRIEIPAKNSDGKYRFKVPITPMDMTKTISLRFEGDPSGKVWEYSVKKYAEYILSDTEDVFGTVLKDLIASMLNYGSAMQRLNGETENLAGDILANYPAYADSEKISGKISDALKWLEASGDAYNTVYYDDVENAPVRFENVTLAVNEMTAIRVYMQGAVDDGRYTYQLSYRNTTESGSIYEKTEDIALQTVNGTYCAEVSGLRGADFHRVFRISVRDGDGTVAYCETTVFSYAMMLYERYGSGTVERDLAEALIWYGAMNVSYFSGVTVG